MKGLLLGFCFAIVISCNTNDTNESKLTGEEIWIINDGWIAENNDFYFIQFPKSWGFEDYGTGFRVTSPKTSESDSVFENIVLYRQSVRQDTRIDYFGARSVNNNQFEYGEDYKVHKRELIKGGRLYYRIDASLEKDGQTLRGIQYMIKRESSVFILSLYCTAETFNDYQVIGEKIMQSFIPKEKFWIKNPEPYI